MGAEEVEIVQILNRGQDVLEAHPEFFDMPLEKVIDFLDDGTEQMVRDRWGVAAWMVIKGLQSFDICDLIEPLAKVKSGPLTYEYVGYLLQNDYGVNLEKLIIEADRQQKFSEIVKYVFPNLPFEKTVYKENICPLLDLFESHISESECDTLISAYTTHITNMRSQSLILDMIGELSRTAEFQVVCRLQAEWYKTSKEEATAYINKLIEHQSILSKRAALHFLNISIFSDQELFQSRFFDVEKMINADSELWEEAIPLLMHYAKEHSNEDGVEDIYYEKTISYLNRIPFGTVSEKCLFLENIRFDKELSTALRKIFYSVAKSSVDKNLHVMELIANALYFKVRNGNCQDAISIMMSVFCANRFLDDYNKFFSAMNIITGEMKKHSAEITAEAIKYLLSDNAYQAFFGMGLLINMGDLKQISFEVSDALSEEQLIHAMTGILYYAVDARKICLSAFELLRLGSGCDNGYIEFCMDSVYGNYPTTFSSTAEKYLESDNLLQKQMAERIIETQKEITAKRSRAYTIRDIQPSSEHEYIYKRALAEQNKQINKNADEKSFLSHLFSKRFLKYGARSALLSSGRNGDMSLRISPFQTFSYELELPVKYLEDPIDYLLERQRYLKELKTDEIDNKRVSAAT